MDRTAYLERAGAVLLDTRVAHFGDVSAEYGALTHGCALLDVTADGRVDVAGADAPAFLQRLLTSNIKHVKPGHGTPAYLLTSTGKIALRLTLLRVDDIRYKVSVPAGLAAALLPELDRYLFTERVELSPMEALQSLISVDGPLAPEVLRHAGLEPPEAPFEHAEGHLAGLPVRVARHDRLGAPAYDVHIPAADFEAAWGALVGAGARPVGEAAAELVRIERGVPAWGAELTGEASPLEVTGLYGITEGKGCYPGQEVIERTLALGAPPRALVRLQGEAELRTGAPVSVVGTTDTEIGHVTSAATLPDGRHLALALVRRRFATADEPLRCGNVPARRLDSHRVQ